MMADQFYVNKNLQWNATFKYLRLRNSNIYYHFSIHQTLYTLRLGPCHPVKNIRGIYLVNGNVRSPIYLFYLVGILRTFINYRIHFVQMYDRKYLKVTL